METSEIVRSGPRFPGCNLGTWVGTQHYNGKDKIIESHSNVEIREIRERQKMASFATRMASLTTH